MSRNLTPPQALLIGALCCDEVAAGTQDKQIRAELYQARNMLREALKSRKGRDIPAAPRNAK